MSPTTGKVNPNISWSTLNNIHHQLINTMYIHTPWFLAPPLITRTNSKPASTVPEFWIILQTGGETWRISLFFQTGSPGKRKSLRIYMRDQRRGTLRWGMPTPGNPGVGSVAPGDPVEVKNGIFPPASSSPPCVLCPGQGIYSVPQVYLSWMELKVL